MSRTAQYARPRSLDVASELLAGLGPGAAILAGGQELMPSINQGVMSPSVIVDIGNLAELKGIRDEGEHLSIGALSVHREVAQNELVRRHAPLLAQAVTQVGGGWQVHNRGTLGGNIVSMHPLYDAIPSLMALQALVEIRRGASMQRRALAEVVADASHGLGSEALLVRVIVPKQGNDVGWGYEKLKGTQGAYSSATAAALARVDADGCLVDLRLVIGSVEALPRDVSQRLRAFVGRPMNASAVAAVDEIARASVQLPLSDQRGDSEYRRAMAGVVARRALLEAAEQARKARLDQTQSSGGAA